MSTKFEGVYKGILCIRKRIKEKESRMYRRMSKKLAKTIAMDYERNRAIFENCHHGKAEVIDLSPLSQRHSVYKMRGRRFEFIDFDPDELLRLVKSKLEEWQYKVGDIYSQKYHTHGIDEEYYLNVYAEFE